MVNIASRICGGAFTFLILAGCLDVLRQRYRLGSPCDFTNTRHILTFASSGPNFDLVTHFAMQDAIPNHISWSKWYEQLAADGCFALPQELVAWQAQHLVDLSKLGRIIDDSAPTVQKLLSTDWRRGLLSRFIGIIWFQPPILLPDLHTAQSIQHNITTVVSSLKVPVHANVLFWESFDWSLLDKELDQSGEPEPPTSSVEYYLRQVPRIDANMCTCSMCQSRIQEQLQSLRSMVLSAHARHASLGAFKAYAKAQLYAVRNAWSLLESYDQMIWENVHRELSDYEYSRMTVQTALPPLHVVMSAVESTRVAGEIEYVAALKTWMEEQLTSGHYTPCEDTPATYDSLPNTLLGDVITMYWRLRELLLRRSRERVRGTNCKAVMAWLDLLQHERETAADSAASPVRDHASIGHGRA